MTRVDGLRRYRSNILLDQFRHNVPKPFEPFGGADAFTKLLLHCDGADASTTFTDSSSPAPHTVTANGNVQIDTGQWIFGGASGLFDGTGDYLSLDGSADFAFGTGDFTIDFWCRFTSVANAQILYDGRATEPSIVPVIYIVNTPAWQFYVNGATPIGGGTPAIDTNYHVAVARASGSTRMFINGTQLGSTYADTNNYINPASHPVLGISGTDLTSNPLNGWMDEIRVSKGIARWTANFTPPAMPYT